MPKTRATLAAALSLLALGALMLLGTQLIHANGWRDIAVGTDTAYVDLYIQGHQVSLSWQAGR